MSRIFVKLYIETMDSLMFKKEEEFCHKYNVL